jgi:hypothetical protein
MDRPGLRLALFELLRENAQGEDFDTRHGLIRRGTVGEDSRELWDFGQPTAIVLALILDPEFHGSLPHAWAVPRLAVTGWARLHCMAWVRSRQCNCNVLRDDGLSYGDYVEQLTFLLFLKMGASRLGKKPGMLGADLAMGSAALPASDEGDAPV